MKTDMQNLQEELQGQRSKTLDFGGWLRTHREKSEAEKRQETFIAPYTMTIAEVKALSDYDLESMWQKVRTINKIISAESGDVFMIMMEHFVRVSPKFFTWKKEKGGNGDWADVVLEYQKNNNITINN